MDHMIFEQVTDLDKYVESLAETKAKCIYRRDAGTCNINECKNCNTNKRLSTCYSHLSIADQLRVDNHASFIASVDLYRRYIYRQRIWGSRAVIGIFVLLFVLFTVFVCKASALEPVPITSNKYETFPDYYQNDWYIKEVLKATHSQVQDINKDGKINCIDYAITYKLEWDKRFDKDLCKIMRNYNWNTGWHHLFIMCQGSKYSKQLYIEPQAWYNNYAMPDYWGTKYDVSYNIGYETQIWLGKIK